MNDEDIAASKPGHPVPVEWGNDLLTDYFATAHYNRLATTVWAKSRFCDLVEIDKCFDSFNRNWSTKEERVERWLLIRAHGAYRSACETAMATMAIPAFNLIRLTIETAAYALHIARNEDLHQVWLDRSRDLKSRRTCRQAFAMGQVRQSIEAADVAKLTRFDELYEEAIELGPSQ